MIGRTNSSLAGWNKTRERRPPFGGEIALVPPQVSCNMSRVNDTGFDHRSLMCAMLESFGAEEKSTIWQFRTLVTCFPASVARINLGGWMDATEGVRPRYRRDGKPLQQSSLNCIRSEMILKKIKKPPPNSRILIFRQATSEIPA